MTERRTGTRTQKHEIAIAAPPEAVWKAITDADELTRWFVEAARVEPGVGGSIWVSWGGAEEGQSRIEAWEPNEKLRVALAPFDMGQAKHDPASPIIDEYTIEQREGKTVLRLVSSGIPNAPEWDGFYDGTNAGWAQFFRTMRHYLEHHAGKPRRVIKIVGKLPGSLETAWSRLVGPSGLAIEPIAGQSFSTRTSAGDALSGQVVFAKPPQVLELTLREFDNAFLAHSMASSKGNQYVYSVLSLFGKSSAEAEAIRARWETWMQTALEIEPVAAGAAPAC